MGGGGGGGSLNLEILKGGAGVGGAQAVLEIQVEGRGSKNMLSIRGLCGFFLE